MSTQEKQPDAAIRIYTDGAGCRPDGKGSAFVWLRLDTGEKKVTREDGLTNNQAEYRAILAALESMPIGAKVQILTDSENTALQLRRERRVINQRLAELYGKIEAQVILRNLSVQYTWIPRQENLAGKLL
jgi:ribonuclease HI